MPLSNLKYAQIIKRKDGDKPPVITKKIIFGDPKSIDESEIIYITHWKAKFEPKTRKQKTSKKNNSLFQRRWMASIPGYITHDYT